MDPRARFQAIADATGRSIYEIAEDALSELMRKQTFDRQTERRRNIAMDALFSILAEQDEANPE